MDAIAQPSSLRILVDAVAASSGGGFSRTRELARDFPSLRPDHRFCFVAQHSVADVVGDIAPNVRVVSPGGVLGRLPLRLVWERGILAATEGRRFRPDVVFSPFGIVPTRWPGADPKVAVIVSNLAPYAPSVRVMYRGRDRARLEALRRLTDRTLTRAHRIFILSHQAHSLIDQRLLKGKTELLPMAPPTSPPTETPPSALRPDAPYFTVVGDLLRYKGFELVVEAIRTLSSHQRPIILIIGGGVEPMYERSLRELVRSYALTRWIRFTGTLPHAEVLDLMRGAVGCIVPSRFENPGRPPVEAMGIGAPLIVSDIPAFREICGDAPLYFGLDDTSQLATHILSLLGDDEWRRAVGAAGLRRMETLSFDSASKQIIESLECLL